MEDFHQGGCLCGDLRYRVRGAPERTTVCHCTFCQRVSGSAFAIWSAFLERNFEMSSGSPAVYEHRSDESGRWIRLEFCPRCGTKVASTFERDLGKRAVSAGTFDDPRWLRVDRHVWTRSALSWVLVPEGVERHLKAAKP